MEYQKISRNREGYKTMKQTINIDVPFITYIIHDKNMEGGRTVTVYKPTQEYYILFELIKFRRLPATFPDIGITVISEGSEKIDILKQWKEEEK